MHVPALKCRSMGASVVNCRWNTAVNYRCDDSKYACYFLFFGFFLCVFFCFNSLCNWCLCIS